MSKITILTAQELGDHITEENLLIDELTKRGHQVALTPWEVITPEQEDLYLIRTTWNYTQHLSHFTQQLSTISDRLYNPLELVKWNANKRYLLELSDKGFDVMPLRLASNKAELKSAIDDLGGDEFIVKPLVSASAIGLKRFSVKNLPELNQEMIVQKFYPSITQGEISLFFFNGEFAYAVKKIPKEGDIRVQEEYGSTIIPYTPTDHELKSASVIIKEIPSKWLYARVDIVPGIGLIELECIEPSLYFSKVPNSVSLFADAIEKVLKE